MIDLQMYFQAAAAEPALPGCQRRPLEGGATAGRFGGGQ
jgi:hypothetical protein